MGNSELFETKEEVKIIEKKHVSKSFKIGVLILGLGLASGIFGIPLLVDHNLIPNLSMIPSIFKPIQEPTQNPSIKEIESEEKVYDQKPEDTEKISYGQANDRIGLSLTNLPIFEYEISSDGAWSGDFVDMKKVPVGIQGEGYKKFQFRCFIDEQVKTATYFGTFKSLEGKSIQVKIYRAGELYDNEFGSPNNAVIVEGFC